jgi:hypothetical protein
MSHLYETASLNTHIVIVHVQYRVSLCSGVSTLWWGRLGRNNVTATFLKGRKSILVECDCRDRAIICHCPGNYFLIVWGRPTWKAQVHIWLCLSRAGIGRVDWSHSFYCKKKCSVWDGLVTPTLSHLCLCCMSGIFGEILSAVFC